MKLRLSLYSRWSSLVWPHPDTMGMGFCLLDFLVFFSGPSTWVAVGCGVFRLTLTIRRNRRAPGLWLYCRFFSRMCLAITCACESPPLWALFVSPQWASQVTLVVKNPPSHAGDARGSSSIPKSGRSLGEGNGNPLQYSCLENSTCRAGWLAIVHD